MCRLFGFRSIFSSQVHKSLISADNALVNQSQQHPDGWGVAYYVASTPHIIKSSASAISDQLFQRVSGIVSSETVLAHLRKATLGGLEIINTHPFQYGRWVFAHNGNIKNFAQHRSQLMDLVDSRFKKFILGETDSEIIFFIMLTHLSKLTDIHHRLNRTTPLNEAVRHAVKEITAIVGDICPTDDAENTETFLTFLMTDGESMVAHQGGKHLYFSTHKKRCSERDSCSYFSNHCESPMRTGQISHLIFSSEPLGGENVWEEMRLGEVISIGPNMEVKFS